MHLKYFLKYKVRKIKLLIQFLLFVFEVKTFDSFVNGYLPQNVLYILREFAKAAFCCTFYIAEISLKS